MKLLRRKPFKFLCSTWLVVYIAVLIIFVHRYRINLQDFFEQSQKSLLLDSLNYGITHHTLHRFSGKAIGKLKTLMNCTNKRSIPKIIKQNGYWLLENYIRAEHTDVKCYEAVTLALQAEYRNLENLIPILERWRAPISLALYTPGPDFYPAMKYISYLRNCASNSELLKHYVTFHIYADSKNFLPDVPVNGERLEKNLFYDFALGCSSYNPSFKNKRHSSSKNTSILNVGRNLAKRSSVTYFVLQSEIDFFPSLNLAEGFFEMILHKGNLVNNSQNVFVLPLFEVRIFEKYLPDSMNKLKKQLMHRAAKLVDFRNCNSCPEMLNITSWMSYKSSRTQVLQTFKTYNLWQPYFIGRVTDPELDESVSLDSGLEKTSQVYEMCLKNYDYHVLSNAFLVYKLPSRQYHFNEIQRYNKNKLQNVIDDVKYKLKLIGTTSAQCDDLG